MKTPCIIDLLLKIAENERLKIPVDIFKALPPPYDITRSKIEDYGYGKKFSLQSKVLRILKAYTIHAKNWPWLQDKIQIMKFFDIKNT